MLPVCTSSRIRNAAGALALACTQANVAAVQPGAAPTVNVNPSASVLTSDADLPRIADRESVRSLLVEGFAPAILYVPPGNETRPLLVAAHGAGGAPEWECEYWRRLTQRRAFVLCLRGTALGSYAGFYFPNHHVLERELLAAEHAARDSEPRIGQGSAVYAGFSQGATMGTQMIVPHAGTFTLLVLIETFEPWNVPRAKAFLRAGGKRVLIVCGSKECQKTGAASVHWLTVSGVDARLEYARGEGHTPLGAVMGRVEASLPWLVAGDAPWSWLEPTAL